MSEDVARIPFDLLEGFMADVLMGVGVPEEDARICADVLITADKRGIHSHGINRLKPMYYDRIRKDMISVDGKMEILRETPTTAVVDGHFSMGHAVAKRSMDLAIEKAEKFGMGMVAVRNSTHYGIAGYYAMMAQEAGMIGIAGTNARPAVAPTYGTEGMLGTNPLTVGFPTDEPFPFILDCATSIWQRGKIEYYARGSKPIPEGLVVSREGHSMTDSSRILEALLEGEAALLPLGGPEETAGYKGYGYSTVVEVLSSALQAGPFLKMINGVNVGHFFLAVDIEAFCPLEEFKHNAGEIMRQLRASRKMPDEERILTAGEKEHLYWLENRELGVPVGESLQQEIITMKGELCLDQYVFPFS